MGCIQCLLGIAYRRAVSSRWFLHLHTYRLRNVRGCRPTFRPKLDCSKGLDDLLDESVSCEVMMMMLLLVSQQLYRDQFSTYSTSNSGAKGDFSDGLLVLLDSLRPIWSSMPRI
jgi:hypothetical protein